MGNEAEQARAEQARSGIFGPDPDDLNVLVFNGACSAGIDSMSLYEAKFDIVTSGGLTSIRWIFQADSDLEAARKVKAKRDNPEFWIENFTSPFIPRRLSIEGIHGRVECTSLKKVVRDLYLRAVHLQSVFEEYGEVMLKQ